MQAILSNGSVHFECYVDYKRYRRNLMGFKRDNLIEINHIKCTKSYPIMAAMPLNLSPIEFTTKWRSIELTLGLKQTDVHTIRLERCKFLCSVAHCLFNNIDARFSNEYLEKKDRDYVEKQIQMIYTIHLKIKEFYNNIPRQNNYLETLKKVSSCAYYINQCCWCFSSNPNSEEIEEISSLINVKKYVPFHFQLTCIL